MSEPQANAVTPENGQEQPKLPIIYHVPDTLMRPIFEYLANRPAKETAGFVIALQRVQATDPNPPVAEAKAPEGDPPIEEATVDQPETEEADA